MMKKSGWLFFIVVIAAVPSLKAQTAGGEDVSKPAVSSVYSGLQKGVDLYSEGKWQEAIMELRKVQDETFGAEIQVEAYFWISLAELYAGDFEGALKDMDALEALDSENSRVRDLYYHKGRAFYYLGRYDDAIVFLKKYSDTVSEDTASDRANKAAAYYWIGESLYSLNLFEEASGVFLIIMEKYPGSVKFEAASYRVALIRQKKVENELLNLLKWSHEEALKTMEEYQRRERSYDQALIAYQKRISELLRDSRRYEELQDANDRYKKQLEEAEARIQFLERNQRNSSAGGQTERVSRIPSSFAE